MAVSKLSRWRDRSTQARPAMASPRPISTSPTRALCSGPTSATATTTSDFYAVVWTGERLTSVEYATTRGWTYANGATIDATDEVKAAAAA